MFVQCAPAEDQDPLDFCGRFFDDSIQYTLCPHDPILDPEAWDTVLSPAEQHVMVVRDAWAMHHAPPEVQVTPWQGRRRRMATVRPLPGYLH